MRKLLMLFLPIILMLASCVLIYDDLSGYQGDDIIIENDILKREAIELPPRNYQRVDTSDTGNIDLSIDSSSQSSVSPEEIQDDPAFMNHYDFRIGSGLNEDEQRYYGESFAKNTGIKNYFHGEYSSSWPLENLAVTEVEIYGSAPLFMDLDKYTTTIGASKLFFLVTEPIILKDRYSDFQCSSYAVYSIDVGKYGELSLELWGVGFFNSVDEARAHLNRLHNNGFNITYLDKVKVEILPGYTPDNQGHNSYIEEIVEAINAMGVTQYTLYLGMQCSHVYYTDNDGLCGECDNHYAGYVEYSVVTGEAKYLGRYTYYSCSPDLHEWQLDNDTDFPYREPVHEEEEYLMEQIIKLGEKYEITNTSVLDSVKNVCP